MLPERATGPISTFNYGWDILTPRRADDYSIPLSKVDFASGSLKHDSTIRPNRLFTADSNIIAYCAGRLSREKVREVVEKIVQIIRS
jgi:mRNA interferase MazF